MQERPVHRRRECSTCSTIFNHPPCLHRDMPICRNQIPSCHTHRANARQQPAFPAPSTTAIYLPIGTRRRTLLCGTPTPQDTPLQNLTACCVGPVQVSNSCLQYCESRSVDAFFNCYSDHVNYTSRGIATCNQKAKSSGAGGRLGGLNGGLVGGVAQGVAVGAVFSCALHRPVRLGEFA